MRVNEKLAEMYPTTQSMQEARKKYNSWEHMGQSIGVGHNSLYLHRKRLNMPRETNREEKNNFVEHLTTEEIDARIKALFAGVSTNIVKVYKIVKPKIFYQDQRGYKGLKYLRDDKGTSWNKITHNMMPYALLGRAI